MISIYWECFYFLSNRKLRALLHGKLLINLCLGLVGIYAMFIVAWSTATARSGNEGLCAASGLLFHYFLLATFCIMMSEAVCLYFKLVLVLGRFTIPNYYALKTTLVAWSKSVIKYVLKRLCDCICFFLFQYFRFLLW